MELEYMLESIYECGYTFAITDTEYMEGEDGPIRFGYICYGNPVGIAEGYEHVGETVLEAVTGVYNLVMERFKE